METDELTEDMDLTGDMELTEDLDKEDEEMLGH